MDFLLDREKNLKYYKGQDFDKGSLLDENVLVYGVTEDRDSSIHLVYLQENGSLNYIIFKDDKMIESLIGNFDTRSNSYNQLEILIISSRINIFYSYSNVINSNIYTIQHVVINPKDQEKYNIIRYVSKKKDKAFSVYNDSTGNIHLLYNTVTDSFSHIYYTYFNPYKNQWLSSPKKLSTSGSYSLNPSIFVDSKDNIHSLYWNRGEDKYLLNIKRMAQVGSEMYKWNDVKNLKLLEPSPWLKIFERDKKILIETPNLCLLSDDYGISYEEVEKEFEEANRNVHIPMDGEGGLDDLEVGEGDPKEEIGEDQSQPLRILSEEDFQSLMEDLRDYQFQIKEFDLENKVFLEQVILNQEDITIKLSSILEDLSSISLRLNNVEDELKNPKSTFKKLFG